MRQAPTDIYFTIEKESLAEIKIRSSRFIGEAHLVETLEAAQQLLEEIRRREYDATHHCYAYRVGTSPDPESKYSDDGEPSGTAGRPIMDAVLGRELTNILVVVTRYYGGIKLGTGGLVRAYAEAAAAALDEASKKECYLTDRLNLTIEFPLYDRVMRLVTKYSVIQHEAEFGERVSLVLEVRRSFKGKFIDELVQLSSGKAVIEELPDE